MEHTNISGLPWPHLVELSTNTSVFSLLKASMFKGGVCGNGHKKVYFSSFKFFMPIALGFRNGILSSCSFFFLGMCWLRKRGLEDLQNANLCCLKCNFKNI